MPRISKNTDLTVLEGQPRNPDPTIIRGGEVLVLKVGLSVAKAEMHVQGRAVRQLVASLVTMLNTVALLLPVPVLAALAYRLGVDGPAALAVGLAGGVLVGRITLRRLAATTR